MNIPDIPQQDGRWQDPIFTIQLDQGFTARIFAEMSSIAGYQVFKSDLEAIEPTEQDIQSYQRRYRLKRRVE